MSLLLILGRVRCFFVGHKWHHFSHKQIVENKHLNLTPECLFCGKKPGKTIIHRN